MRPRIGCFPPPLPPSIYLRRRAPSLPFPAQDDGPVYAFARQALFHAVSGWCLEEGAEVLVPAYHHGSEVEALLRAGLQCRFYGRGDPVTPDGDELDALRTSRTRALHIIHYFGYPQDSRRWRTWCDERGLLLIEDAAQAWAAWSGGLPVGWCADVAVFCAYKSAPVPEGAFVVSRRPVPPPLPNPSYGPGQVLRRHGAWLAQRSALAHAAARPFARQAPYDLQRDIAVPSEASAPWAGTEAILRRAVRPDLAALRRTNARLLLDRLGPVVPESFSTLSRGASPFVLPVVSDRKDSELERLRAEGVQALDLWSQPHPSLPRREFPAVTALRQTLIGLPVHQGLRVRDVSRVADAVSPQRRGTSAGFTVARELDQVRDVWHGLQQRAESPFSTFEWADSWVRNLGRHGRLVLAVCRDAAGEPRALLPLQRTVLTGGVRLLRFLGHGPGDLLGPVCADADVALAARALRRLLDGGAHGDVLLTERFTAELSWSHLLRGTRLRTEPSPVLWLGEGGWDGFLARSSRNFRQQVGRRERALARRFDVGFRLSTPARLQDDLDTLFRLHAARWREPTPFLLEQQFHRDFATVAMRRGWLRLWLLELDGVAAAAWYGLRYSGQEWYYQAGRDPRYDAHRVGSVLLAHTVRTAGRDGVQAYRFLRGGEEYKRHFTQWDPGVETVVSARRGLRGEAARCGAAVLAALPSAPRNRLVGAARGTRVLPSPGPETARGPAHAPCRPCADK